MKWQERGNPRTPYLVHFTLLESCLHVIRDLIFTTCDELRDGRAGVGTFTFSIESADQR